MRGVVVSRKEDSTQTQWLHLQNTNTPKMQGTERVEELEDQGVCCETVFSRSVRGHTHQVPPKWLLKGKLSEDRNHRHAKVVGGKPARSQPYTKNQRQLRRVGETIFLGEKHTD